MRYERLLIAALLAGCTAGGGVTMIRGDAHGGALRVQGSYGDVVTEARARMATHCDGRFELIGSSPDATVPEEGAEVVEFVCVRRVEVAAAP